MTIVIGSTIGSGIFVSTAEMARQLGSAPLLMVAWSVAGVMTFFGAMTQCELVAQSPVMGGLYEYLLEAYGPLVGFFYGWANFMIAGSGAIAAIAYIFASYVGEFVTFPHLSPALESWPLAVPLAGTLYPLKDFAAKLLGAFLIAVLTALNIRGVKLGALVQMLSTSAKVIAILLIVLAVFIFGHGQMAVHLSESTHAFGSWSAMLYALSLAMAGAFWSYDGWGNVAYIAGEVNEPQKTIPRAIIFWTVIFTALYLLVNLLSLCLAGECLGSCGR